ncbi:MAG: type II secretion system F family protein [Elusimicrobia bacterium]|nr:type II secretion system F family protein [Elusimicrobiota bacterium]
MILILLKTLIAFLSFGIVYFIVIKIAQDLERKKEAEKEKPKRVSGVLNLFDVLERAPNSPKAKKIKLISLLIFFVFGIFLTKTILFSLILGMAGFILPQAIANLRKERKAKRIDAQLADGLVLIANSLKAGMSFPQTLEVMARQGTPPLSKEFEEVSRELKIGVPMEKALFNLAERWPEIPNLRIAVIAINIAQEVGGNLAETLARLSETMRKRKEIQGKINALTTQGKISGIITAMTPVALFVFIYWMNPDVMSPMITTTMGNLMLVVIALLIFSGFMVIRKIVNIDI